MAVHEICAEHDESWDFKKWKAVQGFLAAVDLHQEQESAVVSMCMLSGTHMYVTYSPRGWCSASCVIPRGVGVQMSETDFTCRPVCLSESVTYCQGSLLTQGWCCPQGRVLPCVCERETSGDRGEWNAPEITHTASSFHCRHIPANSLHSVRSVMVIDTCTHFETPENSCLPWY